MLPCVDQYKIFFDSLNGSVLILNMRKENQFIGSFMKQEEFSKGGINDD
tara:strand:+ start:436 stop:582 length:147 start_codon:yes stop_codon:yes gene_type:complete